MWWILLALLLAVSAAVLIRQGPIAALGSGVLLSHLFPCWITQTILGASIDLRVATALVLLLVNVFHPNRRICWSFNAADWSVFALYFVHLASDTWQDGFQISQIGRAFGEWSVPYIAGRLAVQSVQDWRWLTGIAVAIATVFALWAASEAITRVNFADPVFGRRPADRTNRMEIRGGFKRAEGPTRNAIWFGMLQTLFLPWTIAAGYRSLRGDGPRWWIAAPVYNFFGVVATLTRGPVLACLVVFYFAAVFCLPKLRKYLIIAGVVSAGIGFIAKDKVYFALEAVSERNWGTNYTSGQVELDGKKNVYTGMTARWLVFTAYRPALKHVGFLGYGTERTATFPVNVPLGPDARQTIATFWTIDCAYLLMILRFGWLGLAAFLAICCFSIRHIINQTKFITLHEQILPLTIAATLVGIAIALVGEWMPNDYGFLFLWLCGAANGPRLKSLIHPDTTRRSVARQNEVQTSRR